MGRSEVWQVHDAVRIRRFYGQPIQAPSYGRTCVQRYLGPQDFVYGRSADGFNLTTQCPSAGRLDIFRFNPSRH